MKSDSDTKKDTEDTESVMKKGGGLERKLTLILLAFAVVISATLWGIGYKTYLDSTFGRYRSAAESVLNLARTFIDGDDMMRCLETGVKSELYEKTQASLDRIKENMKVSYLYFFHITREGRVLYFLSALTEQEKLESGKSESGGGVEINSLGDQDEFPGDMMRRFLQESYSGVPFVEIVNRTEYGYMFSVYAPVRDSKGELVGLVGVDFDMNEINAELASYAATVAVDSVTIALAFTALLIFFIRRNVTGPLKVIAEKAGGFASANPNENQLSAIKLHIKKRDEIGVLASSFEKMTEDLVRYVAESTAAVAAKERIESELGIARGIQAGILPFTFPAFPDRHEFDLYASMTPAREVGGDFYDFFMTDDSHVVLVIADVSGKGVPAALFMMVARTLIKNEANRVRSGGEPKEIFERVNGMLCEGNSTCMFVTAFIGIYDIETGILKYSNAGHNPPLVIKRSGEVTVLKTPPSLVLAIDETTRYSSWESAIEPGDCILLYTDGVTEAFDGKGKIFSEARLAATVNFAAEDARGVIEHVLDELRKFTEGARQSDDITLLAFMRRK
jgi:sigma-B regulation protein RsbU (phosphoserine phosphatase)